MKISVQDLVHNMTCLGIGQNLELSIECTIISKKKTHCNTTFLHQKHGKEALEFYPAGLSLLFPSGLPC